jgi:hypothetical protein
MADVKKLTSAGKSVNDHILGILREKRQGADALLQRVHTSREAHLRASTAFTALLVWLPSALAAVTAVLSILAFANDSEVISVLTIVASAVNAMLLLSSALCGFGKQPGRHHAQAAILGDLHSKLASMPRGLWNNPQLMGFSEWLIPMLERNGAPPAESMPEAQQIPTGPQVV